MNLGGEEADWKVQVVNHAGPLGLRFLKTHADLVDFEHLLAWRPVGDGGDCLFATTQAMANILEMSPGKGFSLVTGVLAQPEGRVFHAWLEWRDDKARTFVFNVSNARSTPVYVAPKSDYLQHNNFDRTIQRVRPDAFREAFAACFPGLALSGATRRKEPFWLSRRVDMRSFARHLLAPTIAEIMQVDQAGSGATTR